LKIFVTGAHGYVGRYVVDALSAQGHDVVAHARRRPVENDFERAIAGYAQGDLLLAAGLEESLDGCEVVVHCAARLRASKTDIFTRDNVTATERLLKLSEGAGARRFIHLSSVVVYGRKPHHGTPEDSELCADDDPYALSKIKAEEALQKSTNLEVVILRPGLIWGGPFDTRFTGRLVGLLEKGQCFYPGPCSTPMPFTHIENLTQAVAGALEADIKGTRAFNVTDGVGASFRNFVEALARSKELPLPHLGIPLQWVDPLVSVIWKGAQLLGMGSQLPLNPIYLQLLNTPATYSIERARQELNYEPMAYEHMA